MNQHLPPDTVHEIQLAKPVSEKFLLVYGSREPWVDQQIMTRHDVIHELAGNYEGLRQIIAFSLETGSCRDATSEIVGTLVHRWAEDSKELSDKEFEFVELFLGTNVANAFRREVA